MSNFTKSNSTCVEAWRTCFDSTECCLDPLDLKLMTCYRKDASWTYGVCKPPKIDMNGTCYDLGVNTCESNNECCSNNCYGLKLGWIYGVCQIPENNNTSPNLTVIITISVFLSILTVILFIVMVILFYKREKKSLERLELTVHNMKTNEISVNDINTPISKLSVNNLAKRVEPPQYFKLYE